jgi:hypothetical protein
MIVAKTLGRIATSCPPSIAYAMLLGGLLLPVLCLLAAPVDESAAKSPLGRCHEVKLDKPEYRQPLEALGDLILTTGGVRVVQIEGREYILAVGMTDARQDSPRERMRRITVARAKALKELVRLFETTHVVAKEEAITETVVVTDTEGRQTARVEERLRDEYREHVASFLKTPEIVATWLSEERDMFFLAVGKRLK